MHKLPLSLSVCLFVISSEQGRLHRGHRAISLFENPGPEILWGFSIGRHKFPSVKDKKHAEKCHELLSSDFYSASWYAMHKDSTRSAQNQAVIESRAFK